MSSPDPEALLAHAGWLRGLARSLVGDAATADDLVQDTWVAALRRPPATDRDVRPWLRTVLGNALRLRWRGDHNRAARERAAAAGEPEVASSEALLERHETQQLLGRLVRELDEPYRATILHCFAAGLTPAQLAARLGIPAGTVRWRLKEALERLRVRLDAEHRGDRRAWIAALAPLAVPRTPPRSGPVAAMLAAAAVVLVAMLAVTTWLIVGALRPAAAPRRDHAPASGHTGEPRVLGSRATDAPHVDERGPVRTAAWLREVAPRRGIHGRVWLDDSAPAAGVLVRLTGALSNAGVIRPRDVHTDGAGRFDFGVQAAQAYVVSAAAPGRLAAIHELDLRDPTVSSELSLVLQACPASQYGRVTEANGAPIANAALLREGAIGTTTDADGRYELCVPPTAAALERLRLVVTADGYGALLLHPAPAGRVRRDLVLAPAATVTGQLLDDHGAPSAGARVWVEADLDDIQPASEQPAPVATVTDATGRFRLDGVAAGRHRLTAVGLTAAAEPVDLAISAGETRDVALRMLATGTLRGRVVRDGAPVAGVHVEQRYPPWLQRTGAGTDRAVSQADGSFVLDRLPLGANPLTTDPYRLRAPITATITAGDTNAPVVLEVEPLAIVRGTVRQRGAVVPFATVVIDGASRLAVNADAAGRYEAAGLPPGRYLVYANDGRLRAMVGDLPLELALGEVRTFDIALTDAARVAGTVEDPAGHPVEGAHVRFRTGEQADGRYLASQCVTDAAGAFECGGLRGGPAYTAEVRSGAAALPFRFVREPPVVTVASGDDRLDGVVLMVDPVVASIRGRVLDRDGVPVLDARVTADASSQRWVTSQVPVSLTDVDGAFQLDGLAPGDYELDVQTHDHAQRVRRTVTAGPGEVTLVVERPVCDAPAAHDEPAALTRPASPLVWDHRIALIGWSIPAAVRRGAAFEITLVYRTLAPLDRPWKVFVHVDGAEQRHNADHAPAGGRCPTSTWRTGDVVVDRFTTTIDARLPIGAYQVRVGFFTGWPPRFRNLPVSDAPEARRGSAATHPNSIAVAELRVE